MSTFTPPYRICKSEYSLTLDRCHQLGHRKFLYIYDFGDCWEHTLTIEKVVARESRPAQPALLGGEGPCPPEDCGGVHGYHALLRGNSSWFFDEPNPEYLKKIQEAKFDPRKVSFPASTPVEIPEELDWWRR